MSRRHREEFPTRPDKEMRDLEHRHVRRSARTALTVDPDAEVLPVEHVTAGRRYSSGPAQKPTKKRFRHWKDPFWKRRTNARRDRVTAEQELLKTL